MVKVKTSFFRLNAFLSSFFLYFSFFCCPELVEACCFNPVCSSYYHIAAVLLSHPEWIIYNEHISYFFFQKITARLEILAVQTSEGPHVVCRWFFLQKFIVSTTRVEIGWKVGLRPCEAISFLVVWCFQTTAGFLCGLQKFCTKPLGFCKLE